MNTVPRLPVSLLPILLLLVAAPAAAVNLHLLVEQADGVAMETVAVPATGELVVERPDLVTVVLPFGLGQSGDLVPKVRRPARLVARVAGGQLRIDIRGADGRGRALPPVDVADLAQVDLRVNVTGAGGRQRVFKVLANGRATPASGPVIDMFGGKIPLAAGDWSLTTETTAHVKAAGLRGTVPCQWRDGLVFVEAAGPNSHRGRFIVDTAAGVSIIARDFLSRNVVIEPIEGVEYSETGSRVVPGVMGGAGGDVATLLGAADLGTLALGDLSVDGLSVDGLFVDGVRANVLTMLPDLGGGPVAGILGLDVLSRCGLLRFERGAGDEGALVFEPAPAAMSEGAIKCPFTIVAKHLVLPATLDGAETSLVLDTGARGSLLPAALANRAKLRPVAGAAAREFRGLDGRPLPALPVAVGDLRLGSTAYGPAVFFAGDLPVLRALGLDTNAGLLGNDLLAESPWLEIDFTRGEVRLARPAR